MNVVEDHVVVAARGPHQRVHERARRAAGVEVQRAVLDLVALQHPAGAPEVLPHRLAQPAEEDRQVGVALGQGVPDGLPGAGGVELREQRGLAVAGVGGEQHQAIGRSGPEDSEQPPARDHLRTKRRGPELGGECQRVFGHDQGAARLQLQGIKGITALKLSLILARGTTQKGARAWGGRRPGAGAGRRPAGPSKAARGRGLGPGTARRT